MNPQKRRLAIGLGIWFLFVLLIGATRAPRPPAIAWAPATLPPTPTTAIEPTATPATLAVAVDTTVTADAPLATEMPVAVEAPNVTPTAAIGDDMADMAGGAASAPVTTSNAVSDTASAPDLPPVDLPPVSSVADPRVALGENVFQYTAGGVGCQLCHGKDARGLVGPNIVGKTEDAIRAQFEINAQMQFIILSDKEMTAVATYLQFLADPSAFALKPGGSGAGNAGPGQETPAPTLSDPVVIQGEQIYQITAGDVGCQLCHGKDATGGLGPNIVGQTADDIIYQFEHSTQEQFITLTDQEIDAVAAYLQYLANPTAGSAPNASGQNAADSALSLSDPKVAQGEQIYQLTAGGVGCQICHAKDATGGIGPDIVGKTADDIIYQFEHSTQEQFITLTDAEIDAVAAYLQYLASQP